MPEESPAPTALEALHSRYRYAIREALKEPYDDYSRGWEAEEGRLWAALVSEAQRPLREALEGFIDAPIKPLHVVFGLKTRARAALEGAPAAQETPQ